MKTLLIVALMATNSLIGMQLLNAPALQQWDGKSFHRSTKKSFPLAKKILDSYDLTKAKHALDVGCGSGDLTAHIAKRAQKVVGIDPSASMINFAEGYFENQTNLAFLHVDTLSFKSADPFDFIFSCNAFHLISKSEQPLVLKRLAAMASPSAVTPLVLIMAAKTEKPDAFARAYARTIAMQKWQELQKINLDDYFQPLNEKTFPPLVQDTGITINKMETVDEHIVFANTKKLSKFIAAWMGGFAFVAALEAKKQHELVDDILGNYVQEVKPAIDGSIEWISPRFVVHAQKK